jgi:ribulose-5-phosphate 4-epimerase/fuculose-1-phosphate aldolase
MSRTSIKEIVSPEEWALRVDLAAAYNLAAAFRMTDHIYTHFSAKIPGEEDAFLVNAYGLMFDEITAANLVKVDLSGEILLDPTGLGINPAGFVIHSTIHAHRHDAACVMHTHTAAGIAVSAQREGLQMLSQHAARFHERVGYHDYHGVVLDDFERPALLRSLGRHNAMILRNHGLLVCGGSVPDAFDSLYYLERACQAQVAALAGGVPLVVMPDEIARRTAEQFERPNRPSQYKHWPALLRMIGRVRPDFADETVEPEAFAGSVLPAGVG